MNKIQQLSQAAIDNIKIGTLGTEEWIQQYNKNLVNQVVGETILAILATDTRPVVYTTYDKDQVSGIISRVVDQVRNHFKDTNE